MVPYENDFARINIPVLSITGYYDDAQISALHYFKQHTARARDPEHYLVIGPYDHFGTHARKKPEVLRDYTIDPVAQIDSQELKLQFMDYVLRGKPKPALLENTVNYEVMGANVWRHTTSLGAVHGGVAMRQYFSSQKSGGMFSLVNQQPPAGSDRDSRSGSRGSQREVSRLPRLSDAHRAGPAVVRDRNVVREPAVRSAHRDQRLVHGRACGA